MCADCVVGHLCEVIHHFKIGIEQKIQAVDKKVGIFEISQNQKIQNNRNSQQKLSPVTVLRIINSSPYKIIEHNAEQHQEKEKTAGFVIKENTHNKQISSPDAAVFVLVNE